MEKGSKWMKVSIIVPVYNVEKYLERCLTSIIEQNLKDYEIVIVNDGSTDGSLQIIQQYQEKFPTIIRCLQKENGGISSARNMGLEAAIGEYITFLDSDDYLEKDSYAKIEKIAEKGKYDIILFDAYKVQEQTKEYYPANPKIKQGEITKEEYMLSLPCVWNKWIKREYFEKNGKLRFSTAVTIGEDITAMLSLVPIVEKIYYLPIPVVCYVQTPGSLMRKKGYQERRKQVIQALQELENNLQGKYTQEIEYLYYEHVLVELSLYLYQYGHYTDINQIADFMKCHFPNWKKNQYIQKAGKKKMLYASLFYYKKYSMLQKMQKLKHIFRRKPNVK